VSPPQNSAHWLRNPAAPWRTLSKPVLCPLKPSSSPAHHSHRHLHHCQSLPRVGCKPHHKSVQSNPCLQALPNPASPQLPGTPSWPLQVHRLAIPIWEAVHPGPASYWSALILLSLTAIW
jgi:hypothetical protein